MSNNKHLIIVGAGGHGKVVADCADCMAQYDEIYFLDSLHKPGSKVADWEVKGEPDDFEKLINPDTEFFVAVGNNHVRAKLLLNMQEKGANIATLVHPSASIGKQVTLGKGTVVLAGAVINILSSVGAGCIVNTSATVDHDCQLGDFVHIAPGVNLAGTVTLENYVFIGAGGTVIPNMTIGANATVGAGATVIRPVCENVTVVGTPAKVIKQHH